MLPNQPNEKIHRMIKSLYPDLGDEDIYDMAIVFEQLGLLLFQVWTKKHNNR